MTGPLPRTAPFEERDVSTLNDVLRRTTPDQRSWLSGFLAGLDAANVQAPQESAAPKATLPLTIVFASESGNCERLASDTAKAAKKLGFKPTILDMGDCSVDEIAQAKSLILIAATWGEGEPPARATKTYNALMGEAAPRFEGIPFAVLALGDTAYADFCETGKRLDARLEALGGQRIHPRLDCDLDFEKPAAQWIADTLKTLAPKESTGSVIAVDFRRSTSEEVSRDPVTAEIVDHINLNSSRSDKETYHIALGFEQGAPAYEPGDAIDIYPKNSPKLAEEVLKAVGLSGDITLEQALVEARDITTLSLKTVETYASLTGHKQVKALLENGEAKAWIEGRQLIDLLEAYPAPISAAQMESLTRPLNPRAYSIASSRKEVEDEVHVLVAAVRYHAHGRQRVGVTSGFLADQSKKGSTVKVRLKPNKHFRLPDPTSDIIMIGPGTGIAPFRAFLQERRAIEAKGRNWLVFGDRRYTHDFLYQLEWQDMLKDGVLTRLDAAFSRDAPQKVYVQDRLWDKRQDLVSWLDNGARFYVCGDAKHMAKDVRAMLVKVYADVKALSADAAEAAVSALESEKRYLQDVY